MEKTKSGFGTASLVLGIIGVCTSFIPIVNNVSFILGLIGGIFAIISLIKKASKSQAVAGLVLCIVAIVITVSTQKALGDGLNEVSNSLDKATGNSTEEILANDVDVQMGKFEVTKGEYGFNKTKLTVKVTNKTNDKKSFSFHIEAVDSDGSRINEGYVYANDLGAGQSQNFNIFTLVTLDQIDAMKEATFKVVEASMY